MKRKHSLNAVLVVAALSLAVAPAVAQGRADDGRQRGGVRAAQSAPAPRNEGVPRAVPRAPATRQSVAPPVTAQRAPRAFENRQSVAPPVTAQRAPRAFENRQPVAPPVTAQRAPRAFENRQPAAQPVTPQRAPGAFETRQPPVQQVAPRSDPGRPAAPRAVPRTNDRFQSPGPRPDQGRGVVQPRGGFNGYDARRYLRPYGFEPYRPFRFGRPYYSFRPRVRLGFGLWIGFGVPYPWSYYGGYLPRIYGYYPDGYYYPSAGEYDYGGLSFDIQPSDADLYVDGEYVGTVGTFTPYGEPLTLAPGVHEITIEHDGYQTMQWEVTIVPGQVIPYQGAMEPW